ncbi:PQQ-binding-like beta-propeller repeat protein [Siphonobacter sp. SORGH_AS_1065]|uniref:outer membrane protein assembly factor BamB family protein n=1 Tax=Siphonobacter sp. SORGH_AS_1065 TaxID=3041795 RepID=UPI002788A51C|nr:PQQ-binding-like beta-propeller repeat protein [Siphonobacter sp. SORGH_AS_1065]MDQ1087528.1 outer membrane protein assembly factor BamB [Siphonobacter sp. SORGH_AS_1065]
MKPFSSVIILLTFYFITSACKKGNLPVPTPELIGTNTSVFISDLEGRLYSFNAQTGDILWEKQVEGTMIEGPAASNGLLYTNNNGREIQAHDMKTGEIVWKTSFARPGLGVYKFASAEGVLCSAGEDFIVGLDARTGQKKWEMKPSVVLKDTPNSKAYILRAYDGLIYGTTYTSIFCIEPAYGQVQWQTYVSPQFGLTFCFKNSSLYTFVTEVDQSRTTETAISYNERLIQIDAKTGKAKWDKQVSSNNSSSSLVSSYVVGATSNTIVISSHQNYAMYSRGLSIKDGKQRWKMEFARSNSPVAIHNDFLYWSSLNGSLYQINGDDGSYQAFYNTNGRGYPYQPVYANGTLFQISTDRHLYAIEESTGKALWTVPLKGEVDRNANPIVLDSNQSLFPSDR